MPSRGLAPRTCSAEISRITRLGWSALTLAVPTVGAMEPTRYEIRIRGALSARMRSAFEPLTACTETVLRGRIEDQAALHGLLERIRDLGLELLDVTSVPDTHSGPDPVS